MAKSAVMESTSANNFPFGKVQPDARMKRKTPSELREEQLKRWNGGFHVNSQLGNFVGPDKNTTGEIDVCKKTELKLPKYINTRLSEVFPVKKSSERFRDLYDKAITKEQLSSTKLCENVTHSSVDPNVPTKGDSVLCEKTDYFGNLKCTNPFSKVNSDQSLQKSEKCSSSALKNVAELQAGTEKPTDSASVDMEKALKGLVARDISSFDALGDSHANNGKNDSGAFKQLCTDFSIPGYNPPLDFTLKTAFRLVLSSSVKWCHRLSASQVVVGHLSSQFSGNTVKNFGCARRAKSTTEALYTKALQSWIYPQTSLPNSIISMMTLSAAKGEKEFLLKRQQDWENSFRSIYYMLRKNMCNIFYVHTSQFITMFIGGNFLEKHSCNAYISHSSRSLRSVLKKQGISFSMPLCCVEEDQAAEEDLVELAEIEKGNIAQTIHIDSMSDVDNSPHSLLAFIGNDNAHALYDFLLNYRFFLDSLGGVDVPVIYAPLPFHNASLSVPEVKCRELMRADGGLPHSNLEHSPGSLNNLCYSIEIKDTILPPWVISGVCAAMSSDERSFESSLITEPASLGLNIALDSICQQTDCSKESTPSSKACDILGVCETVPSAYLRSASLKNLNYSNNSYTARLNTVR